MSDRLPNSEFKSTLSKLFYQGLTDRVIAERMGKSRNQVVRIRQEMGLIRRYAKDKSPERKELEDKIDTMLRDKQTTYVISRELKCTRYDVNVRRAALGMPTYFPAVKKKITERRLQKAEERKLQENDEPPRYPDYNKQVDERIKFLKEWFYPSMSEVYWRAFLSTAGGTKFLDKYYYSGKVGQ